METEKKLVKKRGFLKLENLIPSAACTSLLFLIIADTIGPKKVDIEEWYQSTVDTVEEEYRTQVSLRGEEFSTEGLREYMHERGVPGEYNIRALVEIINSLEKPSTVHMGLSLKNHLLSHVTLRGSRVRGAYVNPLCMFDHEIRLNRNEDSSLMTIEDIHTIIEELAHAEQCEDHPLYTSREALVGFLRGLVSEEGYSVNYRTPGTLEHDAHSIRSPRLYRNFIQNSMRYASEMRMRRFPELLAYAGFANSSESFTYDEYQRLLTNIAQDFGARSRWEIYMVLRETSDLDPESYRISFTPSKDHYNKLLELLA